MSKTYWEQTLFSGDYFRTALVESRAKPSLVDYRAKLLDTLSIWGKHRETFVEQLPADLYSEGRSGGWKAKPANQSESAVEQGLIREVLGQVFHFEIANNQTLRMNPTVATELSNKAGNNRPDMVLFDRPDKAQSAMARLGSDNDGVRFCKESTFILDAKKFQKPIGPDNATMADIDQVERYLRGYEAPWGILSNGRDWRLIRQGDRLKHLTFHLVDLFEDILVARKGSPNDDDVQAFRVFYQVFGPQAPVVLHDLSHATEAEERNVREVLQQNAHTAVECLAQGFWSQKGNVAVAGSLDQATLDQLREYSLIFLYRLLFLFKAEAQGLLPVIDENGASTPYGDYLSTAMIFQVVQSGPESSRRLRSDGFHRLTSLFAAINAGDEDHHIPAYNGGLFEPTKHLVLDQFLLDDATLHEVFAKLIYLDEASNKPVPYAELDVRDLGDIYEGLLEQRLVARYRGGAPYLELVNEKGQRKASGSYFTPDRLVEHLVRKTVEPLLVALPGETNEAQVRRILGLKIVDPSMGSGHFLVKVIDTMALWLTLNCDPVEPEAPHDNGAKELMYWKAKVAEHCVYGVDYNPMSVELAKVAVWLHTARRDKPLTFLDHHLKVGNSLVGAELKALTEPGLTYKHDKKADKGKWVASDWETPPELGGTSRTPKQPGLPFELDHGLLTRVLASIQTILDRPADEAAEVKQKEKDYFEAVGTRLEAFKLLADLWCAQWFVAEPNAANAREWAAPGGLYDRVKDVCSIVDDEARTAALRALDTEPFVQRLRGLVEEGFGPRRFAFFHWELEFPEVFFALDGEARPNAGFDAVVGNPPWDKIKPATKDFYGPWSPEVANTQGKSLDKLIEALDKQYPQLVKGWFDYKAGIDALTWYLSASGAYRYQSMEVDGKKTGGDPDLFRYFVERSVKLTAPSRRVGLVVPGTLWQGAGTSALRVLLLKTNHTESLEVYENYRKWAFDIDSRFKFTTFVTARKPGGTEAIECAFMLRSPGYLDGREPHRQVRLTVPQIEALSPGNRSLLDFRSGAEADLAARIYANPGVARFNSPEAGMVATYRAELHMTNDSHLFKYPDWMRQRGFTLVTSVRNPDGSAGQLVDSGQHAVSVTLPSPLPPGGEYWVAADPAFYQNRGYRRVGEFYVHPDDEARTDQFRIVPHGTYRPLYEGRMVHLYDHAQKAYVEGEGRRAVWRTLAVNEKHLHSRVYVCATEAGQTPAPWRIGFCDVTGATNERTTLAALIPPGALCGNKVPTLSVADSEDAILQLAVMNSLVFDWFIRFRISTTLNAHYLYKTPLPKLTTLIPLLSEIREPVLRLSLTTPEFAEWVPSWTYHWAETDPWKRAELRARLDVLVAEAYGLTTVDFARVLTTFPLLDRDQPALEGDCFVTDATADDAGAVEKPWGWVQEKPRSFITRDLALLTWLQRRGEAVPPDLQTWFRDTVGLDPEGPESRFRIGTFKDLVTRIEVARAAGAVAYVPTGSAEEEDQTEEEE